jgi:hypothetical protein
MAITINVSIAIADTDTNSILFTAQKQTAAVAPEDTDLPGCVAIAKAKMGTTVSEVEADLREQIDEMERGLGI